MSNEPTHFKGPGQWRSQARKLEGDPSPVPAEAPAPDPDKPKE